MTERVNLPPREKVLAKARFEGECKSTGEGTVQGKGKKIKQKEEGRVRFEFDAGTAVLRVVQEGLCGR